MTPASDSEAASLGHAAGQLSNMESAAQSLLVLLAQTGSKIANSAEDMDKLGASIKEAVSVQQLQLPGVP